MLPYVTTKEIYFYTFAVRAYWLLKSNQFQNGGAFRADINLHKTETVAQSGRAVDLEVCLLSEQQCLLVPAESDYSQHITHFNYRWILWWWNRGSKITVDLVSNIRSLV